jgi:hypothetical protein
MQFSNSGRVVIIDDKLEEEAIPLMSILAKQHIPYLYFNGKVQELPETPLTGIRYVFLDIELSGGSGSAAEKRLAGTATSVLKKIISKENGPYAILFWSKHTECIDFIIANCRRAGIKPVTHLDLEKSECKKDGNFSFEILASKLDDCLKNIGVFSIYTEWENAVNRASINLVNNFSVQIENSTEWSNSTSRLFYNLYKAYSDQETDDPNAQFSKACILLNRSFQDELNIKTSTFNLPVGLRFNQSPLTLIEIAKLNNSIFLNSVNNGVSTGTIIFDSKLKLKRAMVNKIFKESKIPKNISLCKIVITPECDLAQNKTIKFGTNVLHRCVYGLRVPFEKNENMKNFRDRYHEKGRDASFHIGPVCYKKKTYMFVFHFGTVTMEYEDMCGKKILFSLKRDLLFDLQSKAANHVNRLGNFQLQ